MKLQNFALTALLTAIFLLLSATYFNIPLKAEPPAKTEDIRLAQNSNPNISVKTVYYEITGSTAEQLREQMNQKGPFDSRLGRRYDGYTQWYVSWNYRYLNNNNRCSISSLNVASQITITLPRWRNNRSASATLINRWNRYIAALTLHENGHKQHGIAASNEIVQALKNMPVYPDCNQLGRAANALGDRIVKKYNQQDLIYDRETRHGSTQGAIFP